MNEAAIFIYGLVVFGIVSSACWLIVWGIVQERRDREHLDAGPDVESPGVAAADEPEAAGR
ncbi:MAG: hypothetical protein WBB30_02965 [Solirubrobacterales bacterium]